MKRDARMEQFFRESLDASSLCLENLLRAHQTSPSQHVLRFERVALLESALRELPEDQRAAIEFQFLSGHSLEEIARMMGRTKPSVAGLLRRVATFA